MKITKALGKAFTDKFGDKDLSSTAVLSGLSAAGLAALNISKKNKFIGAASIFATMISTATAAADIVIRTDNYVHNKPTTKKVNTKAPAPVQDTDDDIIDLDIELEEFAEEAVEKAAEKVEEFKEVVEVKSGELKEKAEEVIDEIINHEAAPEDVKLSAPIPDDAVDELKEKFEEVVPPKKDAEKEAETRKNKIVSATRKAPEKKATPKKKTTTTKKTPAKSSAKKTPAKQQKKAVATN